MYFREIAEWGQRVQSARDAVALSKAQAEQRAIDEVGGDVKALGSNEPARERALTIALAGDEAYQDALRELREAEYVLATTKAAQDEWEAERRTREFAIRAEFNDLLRTRFPVLTGAEPSDATRDAVQDEVGQRAAQQRLVPAPRRNQPVPLDKVPF
jgi:hypothetical protein